MMLLQQERIRCIMDSNQRKKLLLLLSYTQSLISSPIFHICFNRTLVNKEHSILSVVRRGLENKIASALSLVFPISLFVLDLLSHDALFAKELSL